MYPAITGDETDKLAEDIYKNVLAKRVADLADTKTYANHIDKMREMGSVLITILLRMAHNALFVMSLGDRDKAISLGLAFCDGLMDLLREPNCNVSEECRKDLRRKAGLPE